jgi:hypothetical protein
MSYERAVASLTVPAAGTSVSTAVPLKTDFVELLGIRAIISAGTDASTILQVTDADGKVVYLDAAGVDYTTAKDRFLVNDDTQTGLTAGLPIDLTGVAIGAALGAGMAVIKSPITLAWTTATAAETLLVWVYYRSHLERVRTIITVPNPAATVANTLNLPAKYARILGFKCGLTGTDTAVKLKITDADSRVLYLDAADHDYKTAALVRSIVADDTLTGITPQVVDMTGAAMGAAQNAGKGGTAVARSPVTCEISNGGTAGDIVTLDLYIER